MLEWMGLLESCRSHEEFIGAIEAIESTADKSEKNRFLAAVFAQWLETDPLAAIAEVRRVESLRHDTGRVAQAFSQWAEAHPAAAADLITLVLDGRQNDPTASPAFLDGIDLPVFLLSIVSGLGRSDPRLAADALSRSAASPVRTAGIEVLLQDWYPADPGAVQRWAAIITDPDFRNIVVAAAATKAGQQDSTESGIAWAMALADPADRRIALEKLTEQWSQRHAAAAFAWSSGLTDEDLKLSLMPVVMRQFAILDPGAAADWLNEHEASPSMNASVAAYATAIRFVNPAAAHASAEAITDPELRKSVQKRIARPQTK